MARTRERRTCDCDSLGWKLYYCSSSSSSSGYGSESSSNNSGTGNSPKLEEIIEWADSDDDEDNIDAFMLLFWNRLFKI